MENVSKRIFGAVTYSSLKKTFTQILSLLTFFVIVNQLTLEDYGMLHLVFAAAGPAVSIVMLGLPKLMVADISTFRADNNFDGIRALLYEYALVICSLLLLVFVMGYIFIDTLNPYFETDLESFYWSIVFFVIAQTALNYCSMVFEATENFSQSFFTAILEPIIRTFAILSLFFWFGFTIASVLWVYVIAKLITVVASCPFVVRAIPSDVGRINKKGRYLLKTIRKHGKWEMFSYTLKTVASNIGPWVINFFVSTEGVALYAFVMKLHTTFASLLPVRSAVFPVLSHSVQVSKKLATAIVTKIRKYLFVFYLMIYLIAFFLAEPLIQTFAPQYEEAKWLFRVAMLHLFIDVFSLGQPVVFYALKAQRINFVVVLFSSLVTIFMQLTFTYWLGVLGMLMSWLIVGILLVFVREYILIKYLHFPLLNLSSLVVYDEYDRLLLKKIFSRFSWKKSK